MADPIAASRLPDLPNAGYATRTQRELSDAMMFLIRGFERDRLLLLETVLHGKTLWRRRFIAAFRAIKADAEFADAVFGYLVLLSGPNPEAQKARLQQMEQQQSVRQWDHRLRTVFQHAKERRILDEDIAKELLKARRTYSRG